jgi:DNA gyrase inhibitor GyrI
MKYLGLAAIALSFCICSLSFGADEAAMPGMTGTAKITKGPELATKPAMIVASAFVKAADFAPEGGWGEKDFEGAIGAMAGNAAQRLMAYMGEKSIQPAGPMFSVWYEDPSTTAAGALTSKWCFPIAADNEPTAMVTIENMPEMQVVSCTYDGHPNSAMNAWEAVMKFGVDNNLEWAGAPMEVYHKNGMESMKAEDWQCEVVWPAMKKAAPAAEEEKKSE